MANLEYTRESTDSKNLEKMDLNGKETEEELLELNISIALEDLKKSVENSQKSKKNPDTKGDNAKVEQFVSDSFNRLLSHKEGVKGCKEIKISSNSISFPGNNGQCVLKYEGGKYKLVEGGKTTEIDNGQVREICNYLRKLIDYVEHRKDIMFNVFEHYYYKNSGGISRMIVDTQTKVFPLDITADDLEFSIYDNKIIYNFKSQQGDSKIVSSKLIISGEDDMQIEGYNKKFNLKEGFKVAALINVIKHEKNECPKGRKVKTVIDGLERTVTYGNFQWSIGGDLERDVLGSLSDQNILVNKMIDKYCPSIKRDKEFIDYINSL